MPSLNAEQALQLVKRLQDEGKLKDAEDLCRRVLSAMPGYVPALNQLGTMLAIAGRLPEAREVFRQTTQAAPKFEPGWTNLALACERLEQFGDAIDAIRRAIALHGDVAESWHRLGVCLGKHRDFPAAVDALRRAIELDPLSRPSRHDLVMALSSMGRLDLAHDAALEEFELEPDSIQALSALGERLRLAGQFEQAADVWRRVVQADPVYPEYHGQLAMCLLTLGRFDEGWSEYEWRWRCESFKPNRRRDIDRQWGTDQGVGKPDLANRTVLLYSEQGIGDTIQFVRYASLLADRGARVIVECGWSLKLLLRTCPGVRLVYDTLEELPKYDWHIPMLSLPFALETTLQSVPAKVPYLAADPKRCKSWRSRVEAATPAGSKLRVGLAWAGSPEHKNDANRSIDPSLFSPLAELRGITFFSLQKKTQNKKAAQRPSGLELVDFTGALHDFSDTAALIEQMDLIVSVDTAVPHLAGALAKPVWTLLPFVPDFRWIINRQDSPWYPTMRLFRQEKFGDWPGVIDAVRQELQKAISEKS